MKFTIRDAVPQDAAGIGMVHYKSWIETYTGKISSSYLSKCSPERSKEIFARSRCKDMLVAIAGGDITGFCGYGKSRDLDKDSGFGEIKGIYVLGAYQRQGIGKALLETALFKLQKLGFQYASLWVLDTNKAAIDFCKHAVFLFDGTVKKEFLDGPVQEMRFVKPLR
ncbi:MAG: GNAT family N-acetyltransferase [Thermoactinomyces sp.]